MRPAQQAGAHEMILRCRTATTPGRAPGLALSGGQRQRIALARALYGDPVLLVLDEPNSNLDAAGQDALNEAIRQAKAEEKVVVFMAHRPAGIAECDTILIIAAAPPGLRAARRDPRQDHAETAAACGRRGNLKIISP